MTAHRSLSSAMRSNDDTDWSVQFLMSSFHDLRGLHLRWQPYTVPCGTIFGSVSWRQTVAASTARPECWWESFHRDTKKRPYQPRSSSFALASGQASDHSIQRLTGSNWSCWCIGYSVVSYRRTSPTTADSRLQEAAVFVHRISWRLQYLAPEQSSETGVSAWLDRQFGTVFRQNSEFLTSAVNSLGRN